ncbi:MAG: PaaI family thioesterase [Stomatobaculum sp.]|nr:PaaI family thioesterase [Stomatobaculum sp.]
MDTTNNKPQDAAVFERAQYLLNHNPYAVHNHIFVSAIGEDWCEGYLDVEDDVTNVYGMPHGGTYFSLADVLAGMVLRANGHHFVTQSASGHFIRSTKEKRIFARAELLKRGRGTAVIEVRITDHEGKLLFLATFDFFNAEGRVRVVE